jgi:hypothetical protein
MSSQRFGTAVFIVGVICLGFWILGGSVGGWIISTFTGIDFIVDFGNTLDSSTNLFFVFGSVLVIASFVIWALEEGFLKI